MATLTVTAKGQITLRRELLRHLSVFPGQKVEVEKLPCGRLLIAPARQCARGSIKNFSGSLAQKDGIKLTIEQIKEITEMCWAGEFEKINATVFGQKS
jgi:bifunctional DNA-binding transcriptional regulator/antitoxin component of YhaV-PrlF toxin-antitoxin module